MKASIDGKTYTIEFVHGSTFQEQTTRQWTACLIRDATFWPKPPLVAPAPVVAMGEYTWTHPNREIARKKALAIAVKELFPSESTGRSDEVKLKRLEIWYCYFNRNTRAEKPVIVPDVAEKKHHFPVLAITAMVVCTIANLTALESARRLRNESRAIDHDVTAKMEAAYEAIGKPATGNPASEYGLPYRMFHVPPQGCPGVTVAIPYMFERDGHYVAGCLNPDASNESVDFLRPGESVAITHMFLAPSPSGDGAVRFSGERR